MDDALFERILVPLADPEDAAQTARSLRPHLEAGTSLVITHVVEGQGPDVEIARGRDRFAEETYETFIGVLDREDVQLEWVTLYGREVAETVIDGSSAVEATLIAFVPRGLTRWARTVSGDPASRMIQHAHVPVMVFPDRAEVELE